MKQATPNRRTSRHVTPNRITPLRRMWTLARIPSNVRDLIDAEAQKWHIGTGEAIARLIGKAVAA